MQLYLSELKHLKSFEEIENIDKIEIILPTDCNDKIINKYKSTFDFEALNDMICFMLTRFYSKTVDYWITVITDEDGTGLELDISKELFYEILGGVKAYEQLSQNSTLPKGI